VKKKLKFEKFDPKGIPLAELIAAHRQFAGLNDNLGDGFLLALNPLYRNVREEFLRRGFSFTLENLHNYYAFPLMALDEVMASGVIPYRANFPWLEKLEKAAPVKFTLTELKRSELQFNYLFHESAHYIAHDVFFGRRAMSGLPKTGDTLLKILLGEAFANTAEALSASLVQGEIASYFLDANCHFRVNEKEVGVILRFVRREGFGPTAKVLLAAFLYSNFMFEKLSLAQVEKVRRFAGLPKGAKVAGLAKIGLQLSEQFRTNTTQLHLVKLGFAPEIGELLQFDPLEKIGASLKLSAQVESLLGLLCRGVDEAVEFL
jgi:hypothetical protein